MADPIEAHYTPDGGDWTVAVKGRGRTLTGRAPGLIAARDRADQLVEQLAPQESGHKTVVHMLNGDAVEFTTAYLTARLAREPAEPVTEKPAAETPEVATDAPKQAPAVPEQDVPAKQEAQAPTAEDAQPAAPAPTPAPRPRPTPAPRAESRAAHAAPPPAEAAPPEETAPSGS
jgi:hypothetical protein